MAIFGRTGSPTSGMKKNVTYLVNADFTGIATADVVVAGGQWGLLGYHTVPFGSFVSWGANDTNGSTNVAGSPAYINLAASGGTAIAGMYRLVVADPSRDNFIRVMEQRSERFAASSTGDRSIAVLIPEMAPLVQPQSRLELWAKPDANATYDYNEATSLIRLPVTRYSRQI